MGKFAGLSLIIAAGMLISGGTSANAVPPSSPAPVISSQEAAPAVAHQGKSISLPSIYKAKSATTLRAQATAKSKKVGQLAKGAQVQRIGATAKGDWLKVKHGSKSGWVTAKSLTKQAQNTYTLNAAQRLTSKPGAGSVKASLARGENVTATGRTSGKYSEVSNGKTIGWVKTSNLARAYKTKYRVKTYTVVSSTAGGKAANGTVYKNQVIGSYTGTKKKVRGTSWSQVRLSNGDRWIKTSRLTTVSTSTKIATPTAVTSKHKTVRSTKLYSSPNGAARTSLAKGYVLGSPTKDVVKTANRSWLHVIHGGKHLWVKSADVTGTSMKTKLGAPPVPKPKPVVDPELTSMTKKNWSNAQYVAAIKNNIRKYCPSTPVYLSKIPGEYMAYSHPQRISISRHGHPNPNWPDIKAIALHECAHIRQFTAYKDDLWSMDKHMDALWGKRYMGAEYLADCMSDLMGAKRYGELPNGWSYSSGYGKSCNSKQYDAARKILAGKKLR